MMCALYGVTRGGFYAWQASPAECAHAARMRGSPNGYAKFTSGAVATTAVRG